MPFAAPIPDLAKPHSHRDTLALRLASGVTPNNSQTAKDR